MGARRGARVLDATGGLVLGTKTLHYSEGHAFGDRQPPGMGMGWGWGGACDHVALAARLGRRSEPGRLGPGAPMAQGRGVDAEGGEEAAIGDRASEGGPGTRGGLVPVLQVERARALVTVSQDESLSSAFPPCTGWAPDGAGLSPRPVPVPADLDARRGRGRSSAALCWEKREVQPQVGWAPSHSPIQPGICAPRSR